MAAILPSSYKEGTVSVANGSTAVTGTNTFWGNPNGEGNPILPGDWFGVHKGYAIRIASIEGNGALTLANPWPGPSQVDAAYEIMLQSDNARMAISTRQLLQQLMNGNIAAFTALGGEPDTVPYFSGPGAMGLLTRQDLTQGVNYDVLVDTLADRAAYDLQVPGFAIFVADVGDGRAAIFSKATAASGDWSDPAYITGPRGLTWKGAWSGATAYAKDDAVSFNNASWIALVANTNVAPAAGATWGQLAARGAIGPTGMTARGNFDNATAYAIGDGVLYQGSTWVAIAATTGNLPPNLPTTANAWWQLVAQKGTDGTGIGDVVGPNGGVADGDLVAFDGTTGKLVKKAGGVANAQLANVPSLTIKGRRTGATGAPEDLTPAQARGVLQTDMLGEFRNQIINGDFRIWQRAATQTATGYGSDDRWANNNNGTTKVHSQQLFTVGALPFKYGAGAFSRTVVTSVAGAGNYCQKQQAIEDVKKFDGVTYTYTFYAKSDAPRNMAVEFTQDFGSGGSPSAVVTGIGLTTVALTTTWQRFDILVPFPSIAGKVLGSNGDQCVRAIFWMDAGSSFSARTNNLGQQSGTFDISHVSLVEGDARNESDPFSQRHYQQELALCQRYFQRLPQIIIETNVVTWSTIYPVVMRAAPTVTGGGAGFGVAQPSAACATFYQTTRAFQTLSLDAEL